MVQISGHPFASFYWKALIALYERGVPFEFLMVDAEHPENTEAVRRLAPTGQFPVLVDGDRTVIESAAIIEYSTFIMDLRHLWFRQIRARQSKRGRWTVFLTTTSWRRCPRMVFAVLRDVDKRDPHVEGEVKAALDKSYAWLNTWMAGRKWAANDTFGIADCAAAPALFYAHWAFPIRRPTPHFGTIARVCLLARRSHGSSTAASLDDPCDKRTSKQKRAR